MRTCTAKFTGRWGASFGAISVLIAAGLVAATVTRPATASAGSSGTNQHAQQGAQVPAPTPAGADLARGRQVYDRSCGRCHPGGEEDVGPRLVNKNLEWPRMQKQIREGVGRMRPVSLTKLPDANLPALQVYLRSIHALR